LCAPGRYCRDGTCARARALRRGDEDRDSGRRAGRARAIRLGAGGAGDSSRGGAGDGVMVLSIVIVNFNARADLERCLASLLAAEIRAAHEIVVVDNGSTDDSLESLRRWPDVRLVENGANVGFARASNIGIRATSGQNVLLMNNDTIVPPGAIDRLLAILGARPDVAVVGPRLVDAEGRAELSFGRMIG